MSEFKGTQGHWESVFAVFDNETWLGVSHRGLRGWGGAVCLVNRKSDVNSESEANANLIAAAPALLDFAQMILEESNEKYQRDAAREVIAKALQQ